MKSALGLGLLAAITTVSMAQAQNGSATGNGEKPTTTTEASSFQDGLVTMAPGEGITFDAGDQFMLNLFNLFQFGWAYASLENQENVSSFELVRARTYMRGHAFDPSIYYVMSIEWNDLDSSGFDQPIKDAWVSWAFSESEGSTIGLRAGQSQTGFGRQGGLFEGGYELTGDNGFGQQLATQTFAGLRSRGAWVDGHHEVGSAISWLAGLQNGDVANAATGVAEYGEDTSNVDNELNFVGAISYDTSDDMELFWGREGDLLHRENVDWGAGAGFFLGNEKLGTSDVESTSINLNAWLKTKGIAVSGEWFSREDDNDDVAGSEDSDGWQIQASYTTAPASTQYGFVAGLSGIDLDGNGAGAGNVTVLTGTPLGSTSGDVLELILGVNMYYHEHNMKTQLAYVYQDIDSDVAAGDASNDLIILEFQLIF